jgi:hypothetical protein
MGAIFVYGTTFNSGIANITIPINLRKGLNSKQAHNDESKEKRAKDMTLVQVDKREKFCLTEMQTKRFTRLQSDYQYILSHKKQLRKDFPNKYIAVQNTAVRFIADTVEQLMAIIHANGEQVENFAIEYLSERPTSFLF